MTDLQPSDPVPEPDVVVDGVALEAADDAAVVELEPRRALPSLWSLGAWLVLLGVTVALDGLVGGLVAVVVGAVLLARLSPRILGALGTLALLGVPVAVLVQGVPTPEEVSPLFVTRSLVPHHLTFAGLVWAGAWAVLDLLPHLVTAAETADPLDGAPPSAPVDRVLAAVVVLAVAIGAVLACAAVLHA